MEKHFTVTTYIVENGKVVLLPHTKFGKWLPPGGHLELNETPVECAKREVLEETGLLIELIRQENVWFDFWNASSFERPYLCLLENISPHGEKPAHQHIDLIYIAKPIGGNLQEPAKWFTLAEVEKLIVDKEIFNDTLLTVKHLLQH
jgi:ADP-ribose pyrophosphatase YjhB (NUDIX family)